MCFSFFFFLSEQLTSWNIVWDLLVCWLLKVDEEVTYFQQSVLLFAEHGEHLCFFIILSCFFALLCSILLLPISSLKFLLRLKTVTGSFWKISLNALFIDKMFQCLWTTLPIFGRDRLYFNTSGMFVCFEVVLSLSFKSSFLPIFSTTFICLFISCGW